MQAGGGQIDRASSVAASPTQKKFLDCLVRAEPQRPSSVEACLALRVASTDARRVKSICMLQAAARSRQTRPEDAHEGRACLLSWRGFFWGRGSFPVSPIR